MAEKENKMREIKIEKVILSCGGKDKELEKAILLLKFLTNKNPQVIASSKRIPDFHVRPGLNVGTRITLRGKEGLEMIRRLLGALDNRLKKKQVADNHFSFGITEYIDIPGIEYQRDIGIRGFNTTIVFTRAGARVNRKKIKSGKIPLKQTISKNEIVEFMSKNFKTEFI